MIPKKWHHRRNTGHTKAWKFYSTETYQCGKLKNFSSVKIFVTLWYCTTKRPKNGPEKNFVNKNFPHLKILPLTADEIFDLRYEDGKMPSSNNFRVFMFQKAQITLEMNWIMRSLNTVQPCPRRLISFW